MNRWSKTYLPKAYLISFLLILCAAVVFSQKKVDGIKTSKNNQAELMYFPSTAFTRTTTFGFINITADLIWLRAIQYYGQHALTDQEYRYLYHMFDLLTSLSPKFILAYNFGALLLTTDGRDLSGAMKLIDKGISANPIDWSITFTKGFIYYVFVRDYREAGRWFAISSRQPEASEMAGRFAAFSLKKGGDINASRELWAEIYNKSRNQTEREIAKSYIEQIDRELILNKLQKLSEKFQKQNQKSLDSLKDLVLWGYITRVPEDPLGGSFYWDNIAGKVSVKGGRKIH
jgi:hypothetical protein